MRNRHRESFCVIYCTAKLNYEFQSVKDRACQTCKLETEDEARFLLRCPSYQVLRDTLLAKMKSKDNFDGYKLSHEMLFPKLINPTWKSIGEIAKFVSDCLEKRTQAISAPVSNN